MERGRQECIYSQEIGGDGCQSQSTEKCIGQQSFEKQGYEVRGLPQSNVFGIKSQEYGSWKTGAQERWHRSDHTEQWFLVPTVGREPEERERSLFAFLYFSNMQIVVFVLPEVDCWKQYLEPYVSPLNEGEQGTTKPVLGRPFSIIAYLLVSLVVCSVFLFCNYSFTEW